MGSAPSPGAGGSAVYRLWLAGAGVTVYPRSRMTEPISDEPALLDAVAALGVPLLDTLASLEFVQRRLHPPRIAELREVLKPRREALQVARDAFREIVPGAKDEGPAKGIAGLCEALDAATVSALHSADLFCEEGDPARGVARILESMRSHAIAQETLFGLRRALSPVDRFFLDGPRQEQGGEFERSDPGAEVAPGGLFQANNDRNSRGGFSLWIPEEPANAPFPLLVVLHGGSGHGADFFWTWLREGRSRHCAVLAPTARGPTWSFDGSDVDAPSLRAMFDWVCERYPIDPERILLTGLSDGATYSLYAGLQAGAPYTALAPVSGVLHPANFACGNLERARARPIYLVHGALDWMFPVDRARWAAAELRTAGADLVYREIEDLSHTYPREENSRILDWFLES